MLASLNSINRLALQFNDSIEVALSSICEPLFNNFGLTVFSYSHFLNDGTYLDICTNTQWQKHYIEQFGSSTFVKHFAKQVYDKDTQYILWDNRTDIPREEIFCRFITDSCNFNIWNGFSIYKKYENSLEACHFATNKENYEIANFYINSIDLLHHFILYFKEKAEKIIDTSNPNKLIFLEDRSPLNDSSKIKESERKFQDFIHQTVVKRFSLDTTHGSIVISKREAECMHHLSTNKTVKEIARSMELSPRTVESYLDNIKRKSKCYNKSELVNLFTKSRIQYL